MTGLESAGAAGAVVEFYNESLSQPAFDINPHGGGQTNQFGSHQDLEVLVSHVAIRGQVLAFGIGVDRHLGNLASTNRRDEVDSHDPAPFRQELLGVWCDVDVHGESPNPKDVRGGNPHNVTHLLEAGEFFFDR